MIKVLIADDQELMRQSLQIILGMEQDLEVIGAVENGTEVIRAVRKEKPDVIFFRKIRNCLIQNMIHLLMALADRKPSEGISVQIHG